MVFDAMTWVQALASTPFGQFLLEQNVVLLAPELIVMLTIILNILLSMSHRDEERHGTWALSLLGITLALVSLGLQASPMLGQASLMTMPHNDAFFGMLRLDVFAWFGRLVVMLGTWLTLLLSKAYVRQAMRSVPGEFYTLLLTAAMGALFLTSSTDLIMLFVSLETLGITSYLLVGSLRSNSASMEASLKYLIYGGASSAVLLLGLSFLYGILGGSTNLMETANLAMSPQAGVLKGFLPLTMVLLAAGLGFKLSAAPFHLWTPDVYEGAPSPVAAFLSVVSKSAAIMLVIRFASVLAPLSPLFFTILTVFSMASMVVGNTVALFQTNIKRLLGYSTIAHVGYLLLGLMVASQSSMASVLFYLVTYVFMNLGAFASVLYASQRLGSDSIQAYSGLVRKKPFFVLVFCIFLLALSGIPITAGFFAKFFLFQSVVATQTQYLPYVIVGLLASTVSLAYYLNVMRIMVLGVPSPEVEAIEETPGFRLAIPTALTCCLSICLFATLFLGLFATPIFSICKQAVAAVAISQESFLSVKP
jgi:NAD(P)H-quinone oxidoreductase subunit 2